MIYEMIWNSIKWFEMIWNETTWRKMIPSKQQRSTGKGLEKKQAELLKLFGYDCIGHESDCSVWWASNRSSQILYQTPPFRIRVFPPRKTFKKLLNNYHLMKYQILKPSYNKTIPQNGSSFFLALVSFPPYIYLSLFGYPMLPQRTRSRVATCHTSQDQQTSCFWA